MRRLWLALLIAGPCLVALLAYDWIAVISAARGPARLIAWEDLASGALEDLGLAAVYGMTVTPRVAATVSGYSEKARRICLVMLGLGLAWYDVICAWATRWLSSPPDLAATVVVLFVVPIIGAPWYVRWVRTKVPE
ncbi:hypothetical protein [Candidatus Nitrospira bockiana]